MPAPETPAVDPDTRPRDRRSRRRRPAPSWPLLAALVCAAPTLAADPPSAASARTSAAPMIRDQREVTVAGVHEIWRLEMGRAARARLRRRRRHLEHLPLHRLRLRRGGRPRPRAAALLRAHWQRLAEDPGPLHVVFWPCGDHGATTETELEVHAEGGEISFTQRDYECTEDS